jgi:hypothetical protein
MMEFFDPAPDTKVAQEEFQRLLGYPRGWVMEGRAHELAEWSREWYAANGRPWIQVRQKDQLLLTAVCAGRELEEYAEQLWREEKPDEYFFLEVFGSAMVEHLLAGAGHRLAAWASSQSLSLLPQYSPGYGGCDIAEQPRLLEQLQPCALEALPSGALRPKKSQLAVFPLTTRDVRQPATPCETCALKTCDFRRPTYVTSTKALAKWVRERLVVKRAGDGSIQARFRFDGTTCSNMGRPLAFDYDVTLGPAAMDYPILAQQCTPADSGHTSMCGYTEGLMQAIAAEKPLAGRPVGEVLDWKRPVCSTGCYCDAAARDHKWGMVLETIHYALARLPK